MTHLLILTVVFLFNVPLYAKSAWEPLNSSSPAKAAPAKKKKPTKAKRTVNQAKPATPPPAPTPTAAPVVSPAASAAPPPTPAPSAPPRTVSPQNASDAGILEGMKGPDDLRVYNRNEAQVAKARIRAFMKAKDYLRARDAAESYTEIAPQDAEAWLLLGVIRQRVKDPIGAKQAYERHLELEPSSPRAGGVRQRVAELAILEREELLTQAQLKTYKYNGDNWGVYFGFSPVFGPKASSADDLGSDIGQSYHVGVRIDQGFNLGFRYAKGGVAVVQVPGGAFATNGEHQLYEVYFEPNINFNKPYKELSIVQGYMPIHIGVPYNVVSAGGKSFSNFGASLGAGLGARFYTTTFLLFDVAAIYNLGFPLSGIRENGADPPLKNISGTSAMGRITGLDLRLLVTFLIY